MLRHDGLCIKQRPRPDSAPYTATKHALTGRDITSTPHYNMIYRDFSERLLALVVTLATSLDGRKYDIGAGQLDIGNATATAEPDGFSQRPQPWRPGEEVPLMDEPTFTWDDCAHAVLYMASLPLSANVLQMTVMATKGYFSMEEF